MAGFREVSRWATGDGLTPELDGISLARAVTEQARRRGKHFLRTKTLVQLSEIRSRNTSGRPFLEAFLHCMLDKHEGRFWNRSYLALPLLELLLDERHSALSPDRLATLLISDVIRFEIEAAATSPGEPGRGRPDPATLRKRLHHALRFVGDQLGATDAEDVPPRPGQGPESRMEDLLPHLPRPPATDAGRWFDVSVQPVYVLHDEYFFIRALQTHEMVFTTISADTQAAVRELRDGHLEAAVERVDHATAMFERAAALFRIVATMRAEQFFAFRQFTQGASAIQSEQYKRFEMACGAPTASRLQSDAFTNVPAVRAEAEEAGHDSLARACLDIRGEGGFSQAQWTVLDAALGRLESRHQRWKATHRRLAMRMLGDAHGSGYTSGVPYLTECLDNRLFWQLGEVGATACATD
ncbi:tryptophan 2,3-dioxygenase family protein [Streptomyces sp. A1547]|uniref:tryptophan 2,3-dioxygenase family protein n=1 Tax=Streptomyces sp. A1547 TaxID=2563105 RepID=UPI00144AAA87|nr:tryptophan 2,3-dioxygenase family protein [Streptomyces sp. A1547]